MSDAIFNEEIINKRIEELNLIEQGFNIARNEGKEYETFYAYSKSKQQSKNNQDWEILSFEWNGGVYKLFDWQNSRCYSQPTFADNSNNQISLEYGIRSPEIKIHSVKVLSSGEIFSVGDKVDWLNFYFNETIVGFEIERDKMLAVFKSSKAFLVNIKHAKQPLFTTADGKPVYEKMEIIYYVAEKSMQVMSRYARDFTTDTKYYSSPDIPNEYVLKNKKCLSLNDVLDITDWYSGASGNETRKFNIEKLKELVKQKINQ